MTPKQELRQLFEDGPPIKCRMDRLSDEELLWLERTPAKDADGKTDLSRMTTADLRRMRDLAVLVSVELSDAQATRFRELLSVLVPYRTDKHDFDYHKLNGNSLAKAWHDEYESITKQAGADRKESHAADH